MNIRIDIGLFFFFVACAGASIIVWVFNWICWLNQCCCCDFLHNPVNKRIAWWISFTFLLGMLACCISACVTVNRFGFALNGALCSLDRIYYDFRNGTLKDTYPKWTGFYQLQNISKNLLKIETKINEKDNLIKFDNIKNCKEEEEGKTIMDYCTERILYNKIKNSLDILTTIYSIDYGDKQDAQKPIYKLNEYLVKNETKFDILKTEFLDKCYGYQKILFGWMKVLAMVYYCLFLITITLAGVAMMFYACLKRQGFLITIMHVLWNIIRFFMFSFFIFGAAYGIFNLVLKDSVAVIKKLFAKDNLGNIGGLLPKEFLEYCLEKESNFASKLIDNNKLVLELQNFYSSYKELNNALKKETNSENIPLDIRNMDTNLQNLYKELFSLTYDKDDIFGFFDCGFLQMDLNMTYRALNDISKESKILSALSLSSSFFGAIAVYFYLLVLHHYNNELFFDSGKSIFRGFDGFGGGYKKKNRNQDPAYKKRKLRAEIELTSRNEEDDNYKNINKNEEDE